MSKYNDASFIMPQAPYIKAGEIEVLKPVSGGNLTVDRNSKARVIDVNGDDVEVLENVPCFDYRGDYVEPTDNSNYSFGTGNYISLPSPISSPVTNPYSNILRFKTGSDVNTFQVIDSVSFDSNNRLSIGIDSGYFVFTTYDGSTSNSVNYPVTPSTSYEFGVSKDNTHTQKEMYLSGVLVSTTTGVDLTTYSTTSSTLGNSSIPINGFLGEVFSNEPYNIELPESYFLDRHNGVPIPEKYKGVTDVDTIEDNDFITDNGFWIKGSSTTIGGGEAVFNGVSSYIYRDFLTIGESYRIKVNVSRWTSGVALSVGSSATGAGTVYGDITLTTGVETIIEFTAVSTTLGIGSRSFNIDGAIDMVELIKLGNTINLNKGKTDAIWYDLDHDIQGIVNGAVLNDSTDFGNNTYPIETCPSLLTQGQDITNRFQDSANPVSQTINGLTVGVPQTLSCKGGGVITIVENGGSELGGAATEVYPFTFTPTNTSVDVTLSVGHTLEHVNLTNTSYAVNHILTPNGGIATRLKDEITGGGSVNDFNSLEGVLEIELKALSNNLTSRAITISDGTTDNRVYIAYTSASNQLQLGVVVGGVVEYQYNYQSDDITQFTKVKFKYKQNDFGVKIDDVELDSSSSGNVPIANTFNELRFDGGDGTSEVSTKTKYIEYYNTIEQY